MRMANIGDEEGGCARIAISPSFPNLLFAVCRSSNVSPLQDCSSLGIISMTKFFFKKTAVKDGADLKKINHVLSPVHVKDRSSRRTTIAFVKGQAVTQKLFFVVQKHFLVHLACALKDF